jgi:hypothetical protein
MSRVLASPHVKEIVLRQTIPWQNRQDGWFGSGLVGDSFLAGTTANDKANAVMMNLT